MTGFVGRLPERQTLRAALEDRTTRLLVVRGPSGVGKTALVEKALSELAASGPILGRSKYAEQATSAGLRPIVDALSQAVDAALARLYDPAAGAASLRTLVGAQYEALVAAGFSAAGLASNAAAAPAATLMSRQGTIRLVDAMARVLQWLDGFALPVVLFIDDWHRAPNEAVGFVHACSHRGAANALKLVLAARSETAIAYPEQASIVEVAPLAEAERLGLLTDVLGDPAEARAVVAWLGDQASGLPFDLVEIALALRREKAFIADGTALRVDPARAAAVDHGDVNEIIVQRARTLTPAALRLGIAAALWGDRADLEVLAGCLSQSEDTARSAAEALEMNGLLRIEADEIAIPHDRIRAGLLQVPTSRELAALAQAMSAILLDDRTGRHRQTALRLQLIGGVDAVQDCGLAGQFAAESATTRLAAQFDLAADFGEAAWSIYRRLGAASDGDRLAVLREACFAAAHRRQAEATRERCRLLVEAASDDAELADAYERSVVAMRLAGTAADTWAVCREGLAHFSLRMPDRVTKLHLLLAMLVWKLLGRRVRRAARHDARTEDAIASFGNTAGYAIWERGPRYAAYMAMWMTTRARLMGYDSALWLSCDAFISSGLKDYRAAAAFGDRAVAALAPLKTGRGMTLHRAIVLGKMWRDPCASLVDSHRQIYDLCIADNDPVGAANAVLNEALWTWRSAPTLEQVAAKLEETEAMAARLNDTTTQAEIARLATLVQRLREPEHLSSRPPEELVSAKVTDLPASAIEYLSLAEDWPAILRIAAEVRPSRPALDYNLVGVTWRFLESLALLKMGLQLKQRDLRFIERIARVNPTDHLGKVLLLRAEQSYRQGYPDCLRAYSEALEAMQKGSSRLETGLAAECAAAAARDLGDEAAHERFRAIAVAAWSAWGAFGKLVSYRTEQLDASVRARLAEAEAQAAMARRGEQAKSRFLAEIGHELRTPLQAMQGLLDLAAERPEELNLGEIRDVFGSLKSVVDDLTELGALGAEAPLNIKATDLAELLASEMALMQDAARKKRLALSGDLAALEGRHFGVDPDRLRQVVRNLLSNAVKYTDRGAVLLRAGIASGADDRSRITLAVEDTGPGIAEERLPHLFEPFDRAGRSDAKGLGLGLSLSRRIAERMGGSLTAENRGGGGARFVFSFAASPSAAPADPAAVQRPLTILIVEDTVLIRRLMSRLLRLDGHEVIEADTLAEALEHTRQRALDLVLLDLHLPDGDGLALLERWPYDHKQPPVIALTAAVNRETERRVQALGAALLRKPIALADLRAAIADACGGEPSSSGNDFDAEMARLAQEASEEIARRSDALVELLRSQASAAVVQQQAHKLAGLAAQFGSSRIADAADRIEQACARGGPVQDGLAELERTRALQ